MATKKLQIIGSLGAEVDSTLTESGKAADAQVVGNAINNLNTLVGDTSVSAQINSAADELSAEIDTKIGYYIVEASYVNGGGLQGREDIALINFNWDNLIQAIQENKHVVCRMTDEDSLVYTDFLFTEYDKESYCVTFVCSSTGYIENLSIYSNGDIGYGNRRIYPDTTLTVPDAPADAKAVGDAFAALREITATDDGNGIITLNFGPLPIVEEAEF